MRTMYSGQTDVLWSDGSRSICPTALFFSLSFCIFLSTLFHPYSPHGLPLLLGLDLLNAHHHPHPPSPSPPPSQLLSPFIFLFLFHLLVLPVLLPLLLLLSLLDYPQSLSLSHSQAGLATSCSSVYGQKNAVQFVPQLLCAPFHLLLIFFHRIFFLLIFCAIILCY